MQRKILKLIAAGVILAVSGCATQAEIACQNNQPLAGYDLAQTCLLGQVQRAQQNAEIATAIAGTAAVLGTAALVYSATRPAQTTTTWITPVGRTGGYTMTTIPQE